MEWILWSIIGIIILLALVTAVYMWKMPGKRKEEPDYYNFFVMGLIWVIIFGGYSIIRGFELSPLFAIGVVFLAMGLMNRSKWKRKPLTPERKRMKIISVALGLLVLILGILAYVLF